MLGDTGVIIVAGLVGTIMSFSWIMSVETVIVSLVMNLVLAGIYANSNRSLGLNILFRILIIVSQFIIFLVYHYGYKFVENFIRRFAESAILNKEYKLIYYIFSIRRKT